MIGRSAPTGRDRVAPPVAAGIRQAALALAALADMIGARPSVALRVATSDPRSLVAGRFERFGGQPTLLHESEAAVAHAIAASRLPAAGTCVQRPPDRLDRLEATSRALRLALTRTIVAPTRMPPIVSVSQWAPTQIRA